ncbi:MAG: hypothetical protein PUB66_03840 [Oscillospiraceae bacterium]|nr:hypothetical protein [Oscillospiraceae bacterium]
MKRFINRAVVSAISAAIVVSSCFPFYSNCTAYADFTSNTVISRDCPAYSSAGTGSASSANDKYYYSFWNSSAPDYLAYDLSDVPENQRKKVIAVWYNATGQFDYTVVNGSSNGMPSEYTIEVITPATKYR